jgi:hypothetical protein
LTQSLTGSLLTESGRIALSGDRLIRTDDNQRSETTLAQDELIDAYRKHSVLRSPVFHRSPRHTPQRDAPNRAAPQKDATQDNSGGETSGRFDARERPLIMTVAGCRYGAHVTQPLHGRV